ncbi:hypothetical protein [Jannaschia sp. M317]|uniref:hypothetical protein n=1 Tax=Jannaschia sp. M317 TaxID=2867011 RepID=UPI0021A770DA|nr:hypothetical protein [Jannaschia sp. M317]UWQ17512.1 hypothetical protein K3551_16810 [Jannaschia sp. M317]
MTITKTIALITAAAALSGCVGGGGVRDKTVDRQIIGRSSLQELSPGIWVDPRGCDHWLIDDGVEGYLSQRLSPEGKPVCSGAAPPEYVTGPFRGGQDINDPI